MKTKFKIHPKARLVICYHDKSFLGESKFASGDMATSETFQKVWNAVANGGDITSLELESVINFTALQIIRFSASEWGNDHWANIEELVNLHLVVTKIKKAYRGYDKQMNAFLRKEGHTVLK